MDFKKYKYALLAVAAAILLPACSDELSGSDWAPGDKSDAPGIYFAPDNDTYIALLDGTGTTASLKVCRIDNQGELTVPVILKTDVEGIKVPETITFADGSYEATLEVDCADAPAIVDCPVEITFPAEYINPYAGGTSTYAGTFIVSKWVSVSDSTIEFQPLSWSYKDANFLPIESEMYHLLGSNRYKIINFLNTGVDFSFSLMPSPLKKDYYRIVPLGNQLLLSDYGWGDYAYYNAWWLVTDADPDDEEAEYWPDVILDKTNGSQMTIYYIQFLWYDDATSSEYCYVINLDKGTPTAYMSFYGNADEDMTKYTTYYRLRFSWTEPTADQPAEN